MATDIEDILEHIDKIQWTRWLDSMGIVDIWSKSVFRIVIPETSKNGKKLTQQEIIDKYAMYIRKWKEGKNETSQVMNGPYLLHHRKASIWTVSIRNTHPFIFKNFILMHNGTSQDFSNRAKVEALFDEDMVDRSDTYALAKCIDKHRDKREQIVKDVTGVVVIYNTKDKLIEIYGNGERPFSLWTYKNKLFHASILENNVEIMVTGKIVLDANLVQQEKLSDFTVIKKHTYNYQRTTYKNNNITVDTNSCSNPWLPFKQKRTNYAQTNWLYIMSIEKASKDYIGIKRFKKHIRSVEEKEIPHFLKHLHPEFYDIFYEDIVTYDMSNKEIIGLYKSFLSIVKLENETDKTI